jgi:hypothetical protein
LIAAGTFATTLGSAPAVPPAAEVAVPVELELDVAPDAPEDEDELLLLPHPTTTNAHSTNNAATNLLRTLNSFSMDTPELGRICKKWTFGRPVNPLSTQEFEVDSLLDDACACAAVRRVA